MARTYSIRSENNTDAFQDKMNIGTKRKYNFDFNAWADDNSDITSASVIVKSGDASLSNQSISGNVVTIDAEATQSGRNILEISVDTGNEKYTTFLDLYVRDPQNNYTNDYWC